jgi:hypothetical protein
VQNNIGGREAFIVIEKYVELRKQSGYLLCLMLLPYFIPINYFLIIVWYNIKPILCFIISLSGQAIFLHKMYTKVSSQKRFKNTLTWGT